MRARSESEGEDELDIDEMREKRAELKKLKMERELLKMQAETERLRQEVEKLRGQNTLGQSNPDQQAVALGSLVAALVKAGVKPEQANEFLSKMNPEALATLSALTSSNPYLPLFLFIASQNRGTPPQNLSVKDIIEINKGTLELAQDLAGVQSRRGQGQDALVTAFTTLANTVTQLYNAQLLSKLDEVKSAVAGSKSGWAEILEDEQRFRRFKELFGGGQTPPDVMIKLEEMRQQHELRLKQLDLEMLKLRAELLESRRKSKMFSQALRKIGESIGEGLKEAGEESERVSWAQGRLQSQPQPQTLKCPKCSADIPNCVPGARVTCPNCKSVYMVQSTG
jgi:hypothetical protein